MERTEGRSLQDFFRRILVLVCGVPVFAVGAEPGALRSRHLELLIRRDGEVSHRGFFPWAMNSLPVLTGLLAEEQLASGVEGKSSCAAGDPFVVLRVTISLT